MKKIKTFYFIILLLFVGTIPFILNNLENDLLRNNFLIENDLSGDVNGDGKINISDYILVRKYTLSQATLTNEQIKRADINKDGKVNSQDYIVLRKQMLETDEEEEIDKGSKDEYKATFILKDTKKKVTCKIKDGKCNIKVPKISSGEYELLGYSKTKNSREVDYKVGKTITLSSNIKLYAVVKKELEATFVIVDHKAVSNSKKIKTCALYNDEEECSVKTPKLNLNAGYEEVGWSDREEAEIAPGAEVKIKKNMKFYSVTKRTITITFDKNKNIDGLYLDNRNIKADKLSFYTATCESINNEGCKIYKYPIIYSEGNLVKGFSRERDGGYKSNLIEYPFFEDTTLYARVNNVINNDNDTLAVGYSEQLGNMIIEYDKNLNGETAQQLMMFIHSYYQLHPEFFMFYGKMMILSGNKYEERFSSQTAGVTIGGTFTNILINCLDYYSEYSKTAIVHELGHAYDYFYYYHIFPGFKSQSDEELVKYYDMYSKMPSSERPLRDYSYTNRFEFLADLNAFGFYKEASKKLLLTNSFLGDDSINKELYQVYKRIISELKTEMAMRQ